MLPSRPVPSRLSRAVTCRCHCRRSLDGVLLPGSDDSWNSAGSRRPLVTLQVQEHTRYRARQLQTGHGQEGSAR